MATPTSRPPSISIQRPLIDRRRSSSRERGVLLRSTGSGARGSPTQSPVGSPPNAGGAGPFALQGILKTRGHPADQAERERGRQESSSQGSGTPAGVEGSTTSSSLSLANSSAGTEAETETVVDPSSTAPSSTRTSLEVPAGGTGPTGGQAMQAQTSQFRRRVGFDTFEAGEELEGKSKATGGGTGVTYSFTLSAKSSEYCRTRWSRTFLVATDLNEYSTNATDWLLTSLLEDNDEVVVLRVIEPGSSAHNAWKASMEEARDEAEGVLESLMRKNGEEKQISLIVEFAIGPIEETIHRMIEIYKPDSLVVGTRGRPDSLFKSAFMGSISRWAVARSPVPVVVVRPDDKVREALSRRLQDSKRGRSYVSLLSSDEQARLSASTAALSVSSSPATNGAPLERTVTAPEDEDRGRDGRVGFAAGTKDGGKKKKDKGKEFKRFGTFS